MGLRHFEAPLEEHIILTTVAATWPSSVICVNPSRKVFTHPHHGRSREDQRVYIAGFSPLIDDLAQYFFEYRHGRSSIDGGRFYVTSDVMHDAATQERLASISACLPGGS